MNTSLGLGGVTKFIAYRHRVCMRAAVIIQISNYALSIAEAIAALEGTRDYNCACVLTEQSGEENENG